MWAPFEQSACRAQCNVKYCIVSHDTVLYSDQRTCSAAKDKISARAAERSVHCIPNSARAAQDKISARRAQDKISARRAQDKISARRAQDKISARRAQDKISARAAQDKISARRAQDKIKGGARHRKAPSDCPRLPKERRGPAERRVVEREGLGRAEHRGRKIGAGRAECCRKMMRGIVCLCVAGYIYIYYILYIYIYYIRGKRPLRCVINDISALPCRAKLYFRMAVPSGKQWYVILFCYSYRMTIMRFTTERSCRVGATTPVMPVSGKHFTTIL